MAGRLRLSCYPNPTQYQLFVEFDLPEDGVFDLYVRNIQGQLIETLSRSDRRAAGRYQHQLDASAYDTGVYVITLQSSKTAVSERFIVAK